MRRTALLLLLVVILLFALFGWRFIGAVFLSLVLFLLLAIGAVVAGLWYIRRRMERKVQELAKAMESQLERAARAPWTPPDDAIDVEGKVLGPRRRKPRDGADDPDGLDRP